MEFYIKKVTDAITAADGTYDGELVKKAKAVMAKYQADDTIASKFAAAAAVR